MPSVSSPPARGYAYHSRGSQKMVTGRYTRIALFKCLAGKFRLLFDLNLIPQHKHSYNDYSLNFGKPAETN